MAQFTNQAQLRYGDTVANSNIAVGEILEVLAVARAPDFESVFIDGDEALEERYGVRVPVLRDEATGAEMDWPFDVSRLALFLQGGPL